MDPKQMAEILETLLVEGYVPPLYVAAIAVNGCMFIGRYESSLQGQQLGFVLIADHCPGGNYVLPINIMFVDDSGRAARVVVGTEEKPRITLH